MRFCLWSPQAHMQRYWGVQETDWWFRTLSQQGRVQPNAIAQALNMQAQPPWHVPRGDLLQTSPGNPIQLPAVYVC